MSNPMRQTQDKLQQKLAQTRHAKRCDEQRACYLIGKYGQTAPASQEEADQLSACLALWVEMGTSLAPDLWPIRAAWMEALDKKAQRDAQEALARECDPMSPHEGIPACLDTLGNKVP